MGKKRKPDGGPDQAWIVTFSDCMTLLLCFFVMLLSFSTFEKENRNRICGIFNSIGRALIEDRKYEDPATWSPPEVESEIEGGEKPSSDNGANSPPKKREPDASDDAFKDKRVISIETSDLFHVRSTRWKPGGKERYLKLVGKFLRSVPCDVIVSHNQALISRPGGDLALDRSLAVVKYFTREADLEPNRFSVSATDQAAGKKHGAGVPRIQITLLSSEIYK